MAPRFAVQLLPVALVLLPVLAAAELEIGYYGGACPDAEEIVHREMAKILKGAPNLAGSLLRLHFHDCFVQGCDGSVLLDSTEHNVAEKDSTPNKSLRGFRSVARVKSKLEKACPNTVSCADILALMARDAVALTKGPYWPVALGRRDGRLSSASNCVQLPPADANITLLIEMFVAKGLDLKDVVVLSGAHTLGRAHCPSYAARLYNFSGQSHKRDADPSLDKAYAEKLRKSCKSLDDDTMLSEMDPGSYRTFDTSYYRHVAERRGLFRSDACLMGHPFTKVYVERIATGLFDGEFFRDFSESMTKMGHVGVLTGLQGEIRKKCHVAN